MLYCIYKISIPNGLLRFDVSNIPYIPSDIVLSIMQFHIKSTSSVLILMIFDTRIMPVVTPTRAKSYCILMI